uniref:Uncharacterized protein n=1 Tax=Rhizophora mucronata TaxID=61149 RepID=A0A2P2M665_RHIMU
MPPHLSPLGKSSLQLSKEIDVWLMHCACNLTVWIDL